MLISGFLKDIKQFPASFWFLNVFQMLEKLAYWSVLMQLPVYIAQKDAPGGLHWDQSVKGLIFMVWAIVQNLTPVFTGGFADRTGYRKSLFISFLFVVAGYFIFGAVRDVYIFAAGAVMVGFGLGVFKPVLQASISQKLKGCNESLGWGLYFMLYNAAVLMCLFVSVYLKSISWQAVFWGSAAIFGLNFILLLFFKPEAVAEKDTRSNAAVLKEIFAGLLEKKILYLVLIMSGFGFIFMQFYETYSNFFIDWVDSSYLASALSLPEMFTMDTGLGKMVSYEVVINLNPLLLILFVAVLSWLLSKKAPVGVMIFGMLLCTGGFALLGFSAWWLPAIAGVVVYSFGEMIVNPKYTEFFSINAPHGGKARYLSYQNISLAIGYGLGAVTSGFLYRELGEKAHMAADYLIKSGYKGTINPSEAFGLLVSQTRMTPAQATNLLWDTYHPYYAWLPYIGVGILTVAGLIAYNRRFR